MNYDILIKNGKIVDGTGSPWFKGDIGIRENKIEAIGNLKNCTASKIINADGKIVSPGFIDSHTHFDLGPFTFIDFQDHLLKRRLYQGITTQISGCCGTSPAPLLQNTKVEWMKRVNIENFDGVKWLSFKEYLDELTKCDLGTNYASYVGHGTIRFNVMGFDDRKPNSDEMEQMKSLLHQAIKDGAIGISTGLIYPPGVFSDTEELVELCSVLSDYNAIYASHMRSESSSWLKSVKEVIEIAEKNNIPGQIHHVKIKHENSKELVKEFFDIVNKARERGVDITFEQYPYKASWTSLDAILPSWTFEGGKIRTLNRLNNIDILPKIKEDIYKSHGWENSDDELEGSKNILLIEGDGFEQFIGKTLYEISEEMKKSPLDCAFEIIIKSNLGASAAYFGMKDDDIKELLKSPLTMIGADSGPSLIGASAHPRNNGTFPKILRKYVREEQVLSLEEAVYKMTGLPASRFNFNDRGLIKEGMYADIVIFDENKIKDNATYTDPFGKPEGIDYVLVNGCISIDNGEFTGEVNGMVLRKQIH